MTDTYLRSLGFAPTSQAPRSSQPSFCQAWRYQYGHLAVDGTPLFIEHPLGIDACRLSALEAPLRAQDIVASVSLLDQPALAAAVAAFFAAHGGIGALRPAAPTSMFRPSRRLP